MSTKPQLSGRLEFIDGLRGIAVLFMLVLHSAHGWLRPDHRAGVAWYWINSVGGMAAPLFFLLLGIGTGLRMAGPTPPNPRQELARGVGLVVLGYLLRVQMWQLDGAAIVDPAQLAASAVLMGGYLAIWRGMKCFGRGETATGWLAMGGAGTALGLLGAHRVAPESMPNLLRFDVLQGLGLTAVALAGLATFCRDRREWALAAGASGSLVLVLTPPLRSWVPGPLPAPLAAPIAYWPNPAGGAPWAMFPFFPWSAYAAFGTIVGSYLHGHAQGSAPRGGHRRWADLTWVGPLLLVGVGVAWLTSEDLTRVTDTLARYPALTQPVRVGYRIGAGLVLLAAAVGLSAVGGWPVRRLVELGRASLWVYWVHLEFAFGAPSTPIHGQLALTQWLPLLAVLTAAMLAVARARTWLRKRRYSGRLGTAEVSATNVEQGA